ncbi:MAG: glyoxalase [Deltaproteobacteria bacterium]|nr:glyoxalase [Deltaproteobacteria bacterium]
MSTELQPLNERDRTELARGRADEPLVRVLELAYVTFEKPDLEASERFLTDFGLVRVERTEDAIYLRGHGEDPYCYVLRRGDTPRFAGFGLRAASIDDLRRLVEHAGASPIEPVDGPGGGQRVRSTAPNGLEVHVVCGREAAPRLPIRPPLSANFVSEKVRLNAAQRPPVAPAQVHRLGHVVLQTCHHSRMLLWLMRTFGLIVSDYQALADRPEAGPVIAFLRCDRGETPSDHHTIAVAAGFAESFEHAAFEVQDLDAVAMGGEHLRRRGWKHSWGVGRHLLGSQIFDYWRDPDGMMHEHYTDGDLFDASVPTATSPFGRGSLAQWGPPLPRDFFDTSMSPRKAIQLVSALFQSEDLSLGKLIGVAKALSR